MSNATSEAKEPRTLETLVPLIKQQLAQAGELLWEASMWFDFGDPDDRFDRGNPNEGRRWSSWLRQLKLNGAKAGELMHRTATNFRIPDAVAARMAERKSQEVKRDNQFRQRFAEEQRLHKAESDLLDQIYDAGFRAMAMKPHPDTGGSTEAMQRLNKLNERVKPRRIFSAGASE